MHDVRDKIRTSRPEPDVLTPLDVDDLVRRARRRDVISRSGVVLGVVALVAAVALGVNVARGQGPQAPFVDDATAPADPRPDVPWADLTAAEALEALADASDRQAAHHREPDGPFYRHQRSRTTAVAGTLGRPSDGQQTSNRIMAIKQRDEWLGSDGSGRIYETLLGYRYPDGHDGGEEPEVDLVRMEFAPGAATHSGYADLPADPDALEDELLPDTAVDPGRPSANATEPPLDERRLVAVAETLRHPVVPPDVRAGLLRLAARIDGLEYLGLKPDPEGRQTVGIAMPMEHHGVIQELYFAPDSGRLLRSGSRGLSGSGTERTAPLARETVILDEGFTERMPPRPDDVEIVSEGGPVPVISHQDYERGEILTRPRDGHLAVPERTSPAADICIGTGRADMTPTVTVGPGGPVQEITTGPDCAVVTGGQRIRIANATDVYSAGDAFTFTGQLAGWSFRLDPGEAVVLDLPVEEYLQPGVHLLGSADERVHAEIMFPRGTSE